MAQTQPRWPKGAPDDAEGHGQGGRWVDRLVAGLPSLGPRTGKQAMTAVTGKLSDAKIVVEDGVEVRRDTEARLSFKRDPSWKPEYRRSVEEAARYYRLWSFQPINDYNRNSGPQIYETPGRGRHDMLFHTVYLDDAMAASPLEDDIVTYRGGDIPPLTGQRELPASLVGVEWDDMGFVSTSPRMETASSFRSYEYDDPPLMRLHVPAGVGALQMQSWAPDDGHWLTRNYEAEILLQRRLHFRVTADRIEQTGTHRVWLPDEQGRHVVPGEEPHYRRIIDVEVTPPEDDD